MRYKITFAAGFAAGYVLGARAGRERYEQISSTARRFMESPAVQQATSTVQFQAGNLAQSAKEKASDKGRAMGNRIGDRLPPRLAERFSTFGSKQQDYLTQSWTSYPTATDGYSER
jgi:hypothetical protein